jgi:hypothetical protein
MDPPSRFELVIGSKSVRRLANPAATGPHRTETIDDIFATVGVHLTDF